MSHKSVRWLSVQNRTITGLPQRSVSCVINNYQPGLGHHHNYTGLKSIWFVTFYCNLILTQSKKSSAYWANWLLFPRSSMQHKTNWVQVVRIISVQIWSSLIFWSWLGTCRRSAFTAASLQCCTALKISNMLPWILESPTRHVCCLSNLTPKNI